MSRLAKAGTARAARVTLLGGLICMLTFSAALAAEHSKFERGITGQRTFSFDGPPLRAKTQRDASAALVIRLQRGESAGQYVVRFIGNVPGQYDLRDWLEYANGLPVDQLSPLPIEIVSTLPQDQRSDLFETDGFRPKIEGGYRLAMILAGLAWLAVPVAVTVRKMMAVKPIETAATEAAPVPIIDQLRPLIDSASRGQLTTEEKARLELLLLHYWRETEQLPQVDMARSIEQLRSHAQAGPMIAAVEAWLHQSHRSDSSGQSQSLEKVLALLKSLRTNNTEQSSTEQSSLAEQKWTQSADSSLAGSDAR